MKAVTSLLAILLFAFQTLSQSSAVVTKDKADLRGTPSSKGEVVERLKEDLEIEIFATKGPWYLVQSPTIAGWIHGDDIRLNPPDTMTLPTNNIPLKDPAILTAPASAPERVIVTTPRPAATNSTSDGRTYFKGPKGGCYYINSSAKKTYVDHSFCN
jgi:hypothetical protein